MKKVFILLILIIAVVSKFIYSDSIKMEDAYAVLIKTRVELFNKIYDEKYSYKSFAEEIKNIECSKLLEEDLKAFKELREHPEGLEKAQIKQLNTEKIVKTKSGYDLYITTDWIIEGFEGNYEESSKVLIKIVKNSEKWCLSYWNNIE